MEDELKEKQENTTADTVKKWIQDNLRVIISVVIVVVIAGGIYSYSKRSEAPQEAAETQTGDLEQLIEEENSLGSEEAAAEKSGEETAPSEEKTAETKGTEEKIETEEEQVTSVATSKETEKSFIETAQKGEGVTHLARRALSDYLEKNADSELTAEHKIYIEDYLRKKVSFNQRVFVGTTVEFSKDLVKEAITESKKLDAAQLENLHKYAVLVPSLS